MTVEMKNLSLNTDEVAEFLRSRINGKIDRHGKKQLRIQDARARDVKLLMHKFLHQKALDNYRVEVVHPGLLEVFGPEHARPHEARKSRGSPPSAAVTLPYYFPSSPRLPGSPAKKSKAKKKR